MVRCRSSISILFTIQSMLLEGCVAYAQNALGSDQLDELVRHGLFDAALAVRLEVAQVADVAFLVVRGAMRLVERVDWLKQETQPSASPVVQE